jgi:hypothetical protein
MASIRPAPARQATFAWARSDLRRRLVGLVVLGLLGGLAAAVALGSLAGARRSESAYRRLVDVTHGADAVIFASQVGLSDPEWEPIADLPYVESAGSFGLPFLTIGDRPATVDPDVGIGVFTTAFGGWRTDVDRPVIVEGRAPDQTNPNEVLAPPEAREYGIELGDTFVALIPSAEQIEAFDLFSPGEGERVPLTVVGFGRSTFEAAILADDDGGAGFFATNAFHERYSAPATFIDNLLVRFRPGEGSVGQLEDDARSILGSPSLPVLDAHAVGKRVTNGTSLEAAGLALFGIAVAVAGTVLVGQALARSVRAGAGDVPTLQAMGFTRADSALGLVLPHLLSIGVAATTAVVGAVVLSPRFPIGLSRRADPDVGLHADWLVIGLGTLLVVVILLAAAALTAWRAVSARPATAATRRSRLVDRLASAGAPPTVVIGASFALEPGRDARALPTRPALVGVVVGVIGIIAAQTFLVGMDDAIADPSRFGATWDAETTLNDVAGLPTFGDTMDLVDRDPDVEASAVSGRALVVIDDITQPTYSVTPREGNLSFTVLHGRPPDGPDEIALGPETAKGYGVGIGDTVTVRTATGDDVESTVVGLALLPTTPHSSYDQGAWVTADELDATASTPPAVAASEEAFVPPAVSPTLLTTLRPGVDPEAFVARIATELDPATELITTASEPVDIQNLRNVRTLPILFAAFTLVLAVGTVAHVCSSVVRRRGTDLAVLKALGMTGRGTRATLVWQATTLSVIGLVIGIPLGLILGRALWRIVADLVPLVFTPPFAVLAMVLALPATLLIANVIALVPGRRAAHLRPAQLLREE